MYLPITIVVMTDTSANESVIRSSRPLAARLSGFTVNSEGAVSYISERVHTREGLIFPGEAPCQSTPV